MSVARWGVLIAAGLIVTGCRAVPDPSCAVVQEVCGQHPARRLFFVADVCCDPLRSEAWFDCPTRWGPACPPLPSSPPKRSHRVTSASAVFALPVPQDLDRAVPPARPVPPAVPE